MNDDELNEPKLCSWVLPDDVKVDREMFSSCVRPEDHEGKHVVADSIPRHVSYWEVDETDRTMKPLLRAQLRDGEVLSVDELAALWALFPAGRSDYGGS